MAGYDYDAGMSNNAVDAYCRGVYPLSKISVSDLREHGVQIPLYLAKFMAKRGYWHSYEWHHSGGEYYNRVAFYDPAHLAEAIDDIDLDAVKAEYAASKQKPKELRVSGHFAVWGGSMRRPRKLYDQKFTGTKIGKWIHLDGGGKKLASGKNIRWKSAQDNANA